MNLEELMKEHPELYEKIVADAKAEVEAQFKAKEDSLQSEVNSLKAKNDTLEETVGELQKKDDIRTEKELLYEVDKIWDVKLAKADLDDRVKSKIKRHVNHNKFIENDVLKVAEFSEAVDAEIKVWEDMGLKSDGPILGEGFTEKDGEDDSATKLAEENKSTVNRLLKAAGQTVKED
jgi:hypothetical protein